MMLWGVLMLNTSENDPQDYWHVVNKWQNSVYILFELYSAHM